MWVQDIIKNQIQELYGGFISIKHTDNMINTNMRDWITVILITERNQS